MAMTQISIKNWQKAAINVGFLLLSCSIAMAQDQAPLTFEVASVKRSGPQSVRNFGGGPGTRDPGQITCTKARMLDLLMKAYEVDGFQIIGPGWFGSDGEAYDLQAKVPLGATKEQAKIMMQNLLAERFHLGLHHESKEFSAYELVVGKNGPKFKESVVDPSVAEQPRTQQTSQDEEGFPPLPPGRPAAATRFTAGHARLVAQQEPVSVLIQMLRPYAGQPIFDKTGLTGKYDFYLDYDPAPVAAEPGTIDSQRDSAPSMSVALEQQLGLKVQSKRYPFDLLVIDHVEKIPTEN